jgi:hypothetical protein
VSSVTGQRLDQSESSFGATYDVPCPAKDAASETGSASCDTVMMISRTKEEKRTFVDGEAPWNFAASEQREDQWQHKTSHAHVYRNITSFSVPDSRKPRPTQPPFPQQTTRHFFGGEVALNFVVCAPT